MPTFLRYWILVILPFTLPAFWAGCGGFKSSLGPKLPVPYNTPTPSLFTPIFTPTKTGTNSPTFSPTATPSPTQENSATTTPTSSNTPISTAVGTATRTVTSTPTGCGKIGYAADPLPTVSVSAGTTLVGFDFHGIQGWGSSSCSPSSPPSYITQIAFYTFLTGNLDTQILQVQFWANGSLLGSMIPSGSTSLGFSFSGSPLCLGAENFEVKYVLSATAAGTVETVLSYSNGYQGGYGVGTGTGVGLPIFSATVTVN